MRAKHVLLGVLAVALVGCANLSTVGRTTALPAGGRAVHLDAAQRLAIGNQKGWVCAEPSPDALQAYASSLGLGFAAPSKESVSVAQALSASAGSIGLRTQSITLMRDALYRICELYYNDGVDRTGALQLLQRSQDLSLGILAIEQLTGAVVAQQVSINATSAATAAASINDTQKELDKAKADEDKKKTAADAAQTALDMQKKTVAEKTTEAAAAKAKAKATQTAIDALTPVLVDAQTALEKEINDRVTSNLEVTALETKVRNLDGRAKTQKKLTEDLHAKTLAAEKAYQDASKAIPKDAKKIGDLDVVRKAAAEAEKDANTVLAQADDALTKAKKELDTARVAAKSADSSVDQAQDTVDQINAKIKAAREDPNQTASDKAAAGLKTATDDEKKKQDALDGAKKALEQAQANAKEIEKLGDSATTAANASGSGAGSFSTSTNRYGVSKDTVEVLARATTEIVQSVLYKGHLTDSCTAIFFSYASKPKEMEAVIQQILPICKEVIAATLAVYRSYTGPGGGGTLAPATAVRPPPPPPPAIR